MQFMTAYKTQNRLINGWASMTVQITALIPCKDESSNIQACIASARRVADEVLVADSGSTDGTLERARTLADRVVEREYIDSGDFKNWAIPQATHSWVLIVDADERITEELANEIRERLNEETGIWAYSVSRSNYFLGYPVKHGDWARDEVTRLLQRDHCRYQVSTDHAEIKVPAKRRGKFKAKLVHYTAWDLNEYLLKLTHYAAQQAQLWHSQGRRPKMLHIILNAPMRFLRCYVLRAGFLDGTLGFHVATLTAYYSFLKQFLFWQLYHRRSQAEVADDHAATGSTTVDSRNGRSAGIRDAA